MILLWEISRQKTLVGNIYANVVYKLTVYYAKFASFSPRQVHLSPTAQELLNLAPIETFLNNGGSLQSKRQWLQSTILKLSRVCLLIYIKFKFIYQQDNAVALFEEYKHYHLSEFEKLLRFFRKMWSCFRSADKTCCFFLVLLTSSFSTKFSQTSTARGQFIQYGLNVSFCGN